MNKYCRFKDFKHVAEICEELKEYDILTKQMKAWRNDGFINFVFKSYIENQRGNLLEQDRNNSSYEVTNMYFVNYIS
jgi:hypothetical protein